MQVVRTVAEVRQVRRAEPSLSWGLVPTMGALHAGHLALVRRARADNARVAVSIFINPKQFENPEDLQKYPRDLQHDLDMLAAEGVDLVWTPEPEEVYPPGFQTYITVEDVARPLEGAARPGHFRGVATVVAKLFNIFSPDRAYFGQKDAQQVAVIRRMVQDLNFGLELVVLPTLREDDGLAMSSRNQRLSPEERRAAAVLYRALQAAEQAWRDGQRDAEHLRELVQGLLAAEPLARVDYISVAHPATLDELQGPASATLLSLAVFIGPVRLIDNIVLGEQP